MKPVSHRLAFKDARGMNDFLKAEKNTRAVLIAKKPIGKGLSEIHHTIVAPSENPFDATKRLMENAGIKRDQILHNGLLDYYPGLVGIIFSGHPFFSNVQMASEAHAKSLSDSLVRLGYRGNFKDVTPRRKKNDNRTTHWALSTVS